MRQKNRYDYDRYTPPSPKSSSPTQSMKNWLQPATLAIVASIFILGMVIGITLNLTTTSNPTRVDSRLEIDRQAPNPELCQQFGASAIVTDMRVFLTLNPFTVFVTQPAMQPGCVIRQNNWSILEQQKLVTQEQVRDCRKRMNTFGFTGALENSPNISCIYQNNAAGNLFLNKPGTSDLPRESGNV
jgi:hypothetical protein